MKNRNPLAVFFLSLITFGIYGIVWHVKTKNEMNKLGATIPTAWLLIIPFVNWYWLWKYSQGVEQVTGGQTSGVLAFVLLFLLGIIGMAILQNEFNKLAEAPTQSATINNIGGAATYQQPLTPAGIQPDTSFGGPVAASPVLTPQPQPIVPQPPQYVAPVSPTAFSPNPVATASNDVTVSTDPSNQPPQPPQPPQIV